jgi:hypothetical protein
LRVHQLLGERVGRHGADPGKPILMGPLKRCQLSLSRL